MTVFVLVHGTGHGGGVGRKSFRHSGLRGPTHTSRPSPASVTERISWSVAGA